MLSSTSKSKTSAKRRGSSLLPARTVPSLAPDEFYASYEAEAPLAPGHETRRDLYNLYHMLNHYVLFGGFYRDQAQRLIDRVLGLSPPEEEDVWDEDL